ncbi:MAG: gephyrin-like molybdotransferase Glp [Hyphomicrobiaceae bacterium]
MSKVLLDDCFFHDRDRLRHAEALALLRERMRPVVGTQQVAIAEANGRILAEAVVAGLSIPAHTNSAVDGFAFAHADYAAAAGGRMPVSGRAAAGRPLEGEVRAGAAVRIFTGAALPPGLDSVVMQEDVERHDDGAITIPAGARPRANVREAGEDIRSGETLLEAGHVLRPQDLAALASVGRGRVACHERLRVAIVSTGDEIVRPGAPLGEGQVYDANAPLLQALVSNAGAEAVDLGVLPDSRELVRARLLEAAASYDVIITSGGASQGEEDHVVSVLGEIGKRHLWQLAIKPGRPMLLGQIGDTIVLGLPGNPVAVFVCFALYAWPVLRRLGGAAWREPRRLRLRSGFAMPKRKTGRREFLRGMVRQTPAGTVVDRYPRDGSGLISSLRAADALIDIAEDVTAIAEGDEVDVLMLSELGIMPC